MSVEHDYFGVIDESTSSVLTWFDTVMVADQTVEVSLVSSLENPDISDKLDAAAELFQSLEYRDVQAREALVSELSPGNTVVTRYLDALLTEFGGDIVDSLPYSSGDIPIDILRSLQLCRVDIDLDSSQSDEAFSVWKYRFDLDDSDALLVVTFDPDFTRGEISVE